MHEPRDIRLFFALWPDRAVRAALDRRRRDWPLGGPARAVPTRNLHLTLHFIGNVPRDRADCLRRAARRVEGRAFELVIDRRGWFRGARVGWLGVPDTPPAQAALHGVLGARLGDCAFRPEARAFHPHVTVARKLSRGPGPGIVEPLGWRVERFALIESVSVEDGVQYRVVETYPLT